jgi:two-component system CheB/CheR fusion protein
MSKKQQQKAVPRRPAAKPAPRSSRRAAPRPAGFPIVGVGASAGGLEAIEQFLGGLPENCGIAFVIVQHLDPTHTGIMSELLQRGTRMKVAQVKDRTRVQPDCVYVIPPNRDMSILHGVLHLFEPSIPRGLRLPIDFFFRSLAEDQGHRCAGVILSGMGTDGTLGIKAIKEAAGVVLVQDPASAKFDSMPRSGMETGLADIIAPPAELGAKLASVCKHTLRTERAELDHASQTALEKIVILLRAQTGHDFSLYKKSTLYRRIERRMSVHHLDKIIQYVRVLQENLHERELLFNELLIGVTSFFRDPAAWVALKTKVFPSILKSNPNGGQLRAWTPGCSTGEEAYSLAIAFKEALVELRPTVNYQLQIFATDLDRIAVEKARLAVFPPNITADVSPELLRRYFVKEENGNYRVGKEIRDMVTFAPQNLIMDAPFTRLNILICRNLLIYLGPELQRKLIPLFHYTLQKDGVLFLGSAETVGGFTDQFTTLDQKWRIYKRTENTVLTEPIDFPSAFSRHRHEVAPAERAEPPAANLQVLTDQIMLKRFSPAGVLINDKGDILYISGRTGKFLEPVAGKANWNAFAMARQGLREELSVACRRALKQKNIVVLRGLNVRTNGHWQSIDLTVQRLEEPAALEGLLLVAFVEVQGPRARKGRAAARSMASGQSAELEAEIRRLHEHARGMQEEMQTSQEELKSTNEEFQSTNEELQSTNEELTTSKEEMQSLNEELQTVNAELQAKVDELSGANNDMKNLLNSTDIATVFLDSSLCVRRYTTQATRIIKFIPADIGRPFTDITTDLIYPDLMDDARAVLRSLIFSEKQVPTRGGRWFLTRVMPYRTLDEKIDGVVITFSDITLSKKLEAKLRRKHGDLRAQVRGENR